MLSEQRNENSGGILFKYGKYPTFDRFNYNQYIREYVPFHFPQIKYALNDVLSQIANLNSKPQVLNILDVGSGPATVPLAFCCLSSEILCKFKFNIVTLEASKEFNDMIRIFKEQNTCLQVSITGNVHEQFEAFVNNANKHRYRYNWIVVANFLSGIGQYKSYKEVNLILNELLYKVRGNNRQIYLTIIEGNSTKYFETPDYLSKIDSIGFQDFAIEEIVSDICQSIDICRCEYYKTIKNKYSPYVISKTLSLVPK